MGGTISRILHRKTDDNSKPKTKKPRRFGSLRRSRTDDESKGNRVSRSSTMPSRTQRQVNEDIIENDDDFERKRQAEREETIQEVMDAEIIAPPSNGSTLKADLPHTEAPAPLSESLVNKPQLQTAVQGGFTVLVPTPDTIVEEVPQKIAEAPAVQTEVLEKIEIDAVQHVEALPAYLHETADRIPENVESTQLQVSLETQIPPQEIENKLDETNFQIGQSDDRQDDSSSPLQTLGEINPPDADLMATAQVVEEVTSCQEVFVTEATPNVASEDVKVESEDSLGKETEEMVQPEIIEKEEEMNLESAPCSEEPIDKTESEQGESNLENVHGDVTETDDITPVDAKEIETEEALAEETEPVQTEDTGDDILQKPSEGNEENQFEVIETENVAEESPVTLLEQENEPEDPERLEETFDLLDTEEVNKELESLAVEQQGLDGDQNESFGSNPSENHPENQFDVLDSEKVVEEMETNSVEHSKFSEVNDVEPKDSDEQLEILDSEKVVEEIEVLSDEHPILIQDVSDIPDSKPSEDIAETQFDILDANAVAEELQADSEQLENIEPNEQHDAAEEGDPEDMVSKDDEMPECPAESIIEEHGVEDEAKLKDEEKIQTEKVDGETDEPDSTENLELVSEEIIDEPVVRECPPSEDMSEQPGDQEDLEIKETSEPHEDQPKSSMVDECAGVTEVESNDTEEPPVHDEEVQNEHRDDDTEEVNDRDAIVEQEYQGSVENVEQDGTVENVEQSDDVRHEENIDAEHNENTETVQEAQLEADELNTNEHHTDECAEPLQTLNSPEIDQETVEPVQESENVIDCQNAESGQQNEEDADEQQQISDENTIDQATEQISHSELESCPQDNVTEELTKPDISESEEPQIDSAPEVTEETQ